jgi:hypothetical protein
MRNRATIGALLALVALAATGCGKDDKTQVSDLISQMSKVQSAGDAEEACGKVYVVQERNKPAAEKESESENGGGAAKEAGGPGCQASFEAAVERRRATLDDLRQKLVRVELQGKKGVAVVHTVAVRKDGSQLARDDSYDVVHTEEGWRVRIAGEG